MEEKRNLRELRIAAGRTIADVAKALGVSVHAVYHYEAGRRAISLRQILILAKLFEEPAEEIIKAQLIHDPHAQEDNRRSHQNNHKSCKPAQEKAPESPARNDCMPPQ